MIATHFEKNGAFDPVTRDIVDKNVMISNHHLKKASDDFLLTNPWAYQYIPGDNMYTVKM